MAETIAFADKESDKAAESRDNPANIGECGAAPMVFVRHERGMSGERLANLFGVDVKTARSDAESRRHSPFSDKGRRGFGHDGLMTFEEENKPGGIPDTSRVESRLFVSRSFVIGLALAKGVAGVASAKSAATIKSRLRGPEENEA
jgi:hypothetical protein